VGVLGFASSNHHQKFCAKVLESVSFTAMSEFIRATEVEHLSFFSVEPTKADPDIPWPYSDFVYEIVRGDLHLSYGITPCCKSVSIVLKRGVETLYELNLTTVDDVRYHNEKGRELLEIVLADGARMLLTVDPNITIRQFG
jgi:hypothetical protein